MHFRLLEAVNNKFYANFSSIPYRNLDVINFVFGGFRNDPIPKQFGRRVINSKSTVIFMISTGAVCCNLI